LEDPALRVRLGAGGRKLYETRFTFEHMLRNTLAIYEDVLDRPYRREAERVAA
jgi:glycosyltransferase involved in cell wall biosynthesis